MSRGRCSTTIAPEPAGIPTSRATPRWATASTTGCGWKTCGWTNDRCRRAAVTARRRDTLYQGDTLQSSVRYLSTRDSGRKPATYSFEDVLLAGLAEDGGLYVPEVLPRLDFADLAGLSYGELAARIVGLFAGDNFSAAELRRMCEAAYAGDGHPAVTPLVQLDRNL